MARLAGKAPVADAAARPFTRRAALGDISNSHVPVAAGTAKPAVKPVRCVRGYW